MQKLGVATLQPLSPQSTNNFTAWPFVSLVPHLRIRLTNVSCSTAVCIYWKKKKDPCISGPAQFKPVLSKVNCIAEEGI